MAKWVKGQSGNPKGRPLRGKSVAELARAIAAEHAAFQPEGETVTCSRLEMLLRVLLTMAIDGDMRAARCFLEYMEGRPVQQVVAKVEQQGVRVLTADELAIMFAKAIAGLQGWDGEGASVARLALPDNSKSG